MRFYGEGKGPILLDNVRCVGVENSILECYYDRHTADCSHSQDVGVVCHTRKLIFNQCQPPTGQS